MPITKLVCLGDSLTYGYNMDNQDKWLNLLTEKMNIPIINCGISGDTTAGMLSRFSSEVLREKPSHLFIMGGTNDLYFDLEDTLIISNIKAIIRQATHHDIKCILGIPTPIYPIHPPDTGLFITEDALLKRLDTFQDNLKAFACEDELPIINFSPNMPRELFLLDGVHPNEEGQKAMADTAYHTLLNIS